MFGVALRRMARVIMTTKRMATRVAVAAAVAFCIADGTAHGASDPVAATGWNVDFILG